MKHKGFSLVELLIIIGILGLLIGILLPYLTAVFRKAEQTECTNNLNGIGQGLAAASRQSQQTEGSGNPSDIGHGLAAAFREARRTECANNLRSIGQSLKIYAAGNRRNAYPSIYSRKGTDRADVEQWGGDWDEDTWELADHGEADLAIGDTEPFTCNLSCLYLLIRNGMSDPSMFVCPGDPNGEVDDTPKPERFWSFKKLTNCSYSYQNQLGRIWTEGNVNATVVIMADKNPLREDNQLKPDGAASDEAYTWNSPNHGFEGQNCLYADGHVAYNKTPHCGWNGNNIWIRETWNSDAGKWEPDESSTTQGGRDYAATIDDVRDSWLVP